MAIGVLVIAALLVLGTRRRAMIPVADPVDRRDDLRFHLQHGRGSDRHDGVKYFPYVLTLFLFVLFANLLGLIPMSFTTTSHFRRDGDAGADGVSWP